MFIKILATSIACQPTVCQGPPGVGKTAMLDQVTRLACEIFVDKFAGDYKIDPNRPPLRLWGPALNPYVFGTPVVVNDRLAIRVPDPLSSLLDEVREGHVRVLIIEDLTSAPPLLHPLLQGLFDPKKAIGGESLPPNLLVAGTANRGHSALTEFLSPLMGRLALYEIPSTRATFPGDFVDYWGDEPHLFKPEIMYLWRQWRSIIAAWAVKHPDDVITDDPLPGEKYSCPRQLDYFTRQCALHGIDPREPDLDLVERIASARFPPSVTASIVAYLRGFSLPDPEQVVLEGRIPRLPPDQKVALMGVINSFLKSRFLEADVNKMRGDYEGRLLLGLREIISQLCEEHAFDLRALMLSGGVSTWITSRGSLITRLTGLPDVPDPDKGIYEAFFRPEWYNESLVTYHRTQEALVGNR